VVLVLVEQIEIWGFVTCGEHDGHASHAGASVNAPGFLMLAVCEPPGSTTLSTRGLP
jgi:hypothetical protein